MVVNFGIAFAGTGGGCFGFPVGGVLGVAFPIGGVLGVAFTIGGPCLGSGSAGGGGLGCGRVRLFCIVIDGFGCINGFCCGSVTVGNCLTIGDVIGGSVVRSGCGCWFISVVDVCSRGGSVVSECDVNRGLPCIVVCGMFGCVFCCGCDEDALLFCLGLGNVGVSFTVPCACVVIRAPADCGAKFAYRLVPAEIFTHVFVFGGLFGFIDVICTHMCLTFGLSAGVIFIWCIGPNLVSRGIKYLDGSAPCGYGSLYSTQCGIFLPSVPSRLDMNTSPIAGGL
jgi:hypothetical protein